MTCERHGGNAGSIVCRECDWEVIETEEIARALDAVERSGLLPPLPKDSSQ